MENLIRRVRNILLLELMLPLGDLGTGSKIHHYYHLIKKMNKWTNQEIESWQNKMLQKLINHFYRNTKYYKQLFDDLDINPNDIKTREDLKRLPPLNKDIIRQNFDDLIPQNINAIPHKKASTGGSTGNPLKYFLDLKTWSYTTAAKIYSWQTTDYLYGDSYAALGSSSLFPTNKKSWKHILYFFLRNGVPINGMNLSDEKCEDYINVIRKEKVNYLYGYASSLFLLAKYIKKKGIKLEIKGCFPTSEILTDSYRKEMEEAFGSFVLDGYGARDGGITAYEINRGYYNVGYNSIAEVINCSSDDTGTLLVTDLLNYAFPFIRYEVGDEATLPSNKIEYEYNGQIISKILGRVSDVIRLENGHVLTGPGFTILFKDLNVVAYRISKIDILKIKIEVQRNNNYSIEEEKLIYNTIKKHAGEDCKIMIRYVDKMATKKNGKRAYLIN